MKLYQTWREGMNATDTAILTLGWVVLPASVFNPDNTAHMWRLLIGINLGIAAIRLTIGGKVINLKWRPHAKKDNTNSGTEPGDHSGNAAGNKPGV